MKISKLIITLLSFLLILTGCASGGKDKPQKDNWNDFENQKTIVIGFDNTFVPMGFQDKSGKNIGFDIDTSVSYNIKTLIDIDSMVDSMGIYSYLFGPRDDDPKSVEQKRFVCSCGKTVSSRSGIICPYCKGETVLVEKIRGWIKLKYRIFNPYWFDVFLKHLRKLEPKDKDKKKPSIFKAREEASTCKRTSPLPYTSTSKVFVSRFFSE